MSAEHYQGNYIPADKMAVFLEKRSGVAGGTAAPAKYLIYAIMGMRQIRALLSALTTEKETSVKHI